MKNGESKMEPIVEYESEVSRQGERERQERAQREIFENQLDTFSNEEIEQAFFWMERE